MKILNFLRLKHSHIKTLDVELKILEGDTRKLIIRETFKDARDFNKEESDENIENEALKWSQ